MTDQASQHPAPTASSATTSVGTATGTRAESASTCCSDTPQARRRQSRARRLVVMSGAAALAVVVLGLVVGGWIGGVLVLIIAAGIAATSAGAWSRLSLNDRLMRVAVVVLLLALALVRSFPR